MERLEELSEFVPVIMTIVAILIVVVEWIFLGLRKKIERHKEGITNTLSALLTFIPTFIFNKLIIISLMFFFYEYRLFDLSFEWYIWALAYILYDFLFYITHLISHKVRLLWCIHSVHHSPKEMKASVSFRGSFAEFILAPHLILWLPLLGFHPFIILIVEGAGLLYGVPVHLSEKWLKKRKMNKRNLLFITPAFHRLHHAKNDLYVDTNYGLTFSIWDRLFRTFQLEFNEDRPEYGLKKDVNSENLLESQTNEFINLWKDIKSTDQWQYKIKYLFMPPGWNHIDGGLTAKKIRFNILEKKKSELNP